MHTHALSVLQPGANIWCTNMSRNLAEKETWHLVNTLVNRDWHLAREFALGAADPQAMRMELEKALKAYYDTSEEDKDSVKANQ